MARPAIMDGLRTHGPASLTLTISDALPNHIRSRVRELTRLHTPEVDRHQGLASVLMQKVCAEADAQNFVMILTTDEKLIGFYNKFGFSAIQTTPVILMARRANG